MFDMIRSVLALAAPVFFTDQYWKEKIRKDPDLPRTALHETVILRFSQNRGMFMNLLDDHPRLTAGMSASMFVILLGWMSGITRKEKSGLLHLAFGLLTGGAASNIYDHLHQGYVTDYIGFQRPARLRHISYNLADFSIFLAVFLLLVSECRKS